MATKFRVLGAGVWGLAFSDYLLNMGHNVEIFRRDTSLEAESIQQLELKNVTSNHVKSMDALNNQKLDNAINIIAVNSKGFSVLLNNYERYDDKSWIKISYKNIKNEDKILNIDLKLIISITDVKLIL